MGPVKKFACLFCDFVSGNSSNINCHLNHFVSEIAESRGIVYQFDDHHPRGIIREARYLTQHLWEKKNKPLKWNFNKDSNIRALQQGFKTGLVQELALDEKSVEQYVNRRWKAVKSEFWNRAVKSGVDIIKDCAQENRAPNIQNIVASAIEVARGLWVSIEEDEPETSEDELSNNRDREPSPQRPSKRHKANEPIGRVIGANISAAKMSGVLISQVDQNVNDDSFQVVVERPAKPFTPARNRHRALSVGTPSVTPDALLTLEIFVLGTSNATITVIPGCSLKDLVDECFAAVSKDIESIAALSKLTTAITGVAGKGPNGAEMWPCKWTEKIWCQFMEMAELERSPPVWEATMGFADA